MFKTVRQHLAVKLFLSYLAVILAVVLVLGVVLELVLPASFYNHMLPMMGMMESPMMGMMGEGKGHEFYTGFRNAVNQALIWSGLAALTAALVVSVLVSRKVVSPVQEMKAVSQRIASGNYDQRVKVPDNPEKGDELSQLATSFNQMAEALAQTEDMRRQLIGDVSHELRTPLTAIKGSLEGLIDGVLPPTAETFEQIHREATRLQRLVSDLQELSRIEASADPLKFERIDLSHLIHTITQRLHSQFEEKGVNLEVIIPESLARVHADEDRINQVLVNLVGNALQYTPSGGEVRVSASRSGHEVQVSVEDTGIGISAEHLPHLFTRFYRVDKSRSRAGGGSGIGLTIARHLVEAHGGRIWAESGGVGQGSRFCFTLPVDEGK